MNRRSGPYIDDESSTGIVCQRIAVFSTLIVVALTSRVAWVSGTPLTPRQLLRSTIPGLDNLSIAGRTIGAPFMRLVLGTLDFSLDPARLALNLPVPPKAQA